MEKASKQAHKRLTKEYLALLKQKLDFMIAKPLDSNILEWHYVLFGPSDSIYSGGEYWGVLHFPKEYPFKPPGIVIMTPNGRFQTNMRLCLSISDYHPETWNPSWSVESILTGLLSFMLDKASATGTIITAPNVAAELAAASCKWNRDQLKFRQVFPELINQLPTRSLPVQKQETGTPETEPKGGQLNSNGSTRVYLIAITISVLIISFLFSVVSRVLANM